MLSVGAVVFWMCNILKIKFTHTNAVWKSDSPNKEFYFAWYIKSTEREAAKQTENTFAGAFGTSSAAGDDEF